VQNEKKKNNNKNMVAVTVSDKGQKDTDERFFLEKAKRNFLGFYI